LKRALAALALLALALLVRPARAGIPEFSSFDVAAPEEDDENLLDQYLARAPEGWRDEWEHSTSALRADQGCMTSGIWHQVNAFKARAPMGQRSWLDVGYEQVTDPEASWQWLRFDFRFPTRRFGAPGIRFQPAYDKSQHDFAALWDAGNDTTAFQMQAAFNLTDAFNSFWEFRQTRVGNHAEPYRAHPYEPELRIVSRGPRHRIELGGRWLTPSRKAIEDPLPALSGTSTLHGSRAYGSVEGALAGLRMLARFESVEARSTSRIGAATGNNRSARQRWLAEGAVRRALTPSVHAEFRFFYQERAQDWRPPLADASFRGFDRMSAGEIDWRAREDWLLRLGLLYDRINIIRYGNVPAFSWGTRRESRAFIGLQARFGRIRVQGIEGIELDTEPYVVSFHHDKGFLHLQTTF
jgi:hypothetical protein